MAQPYLDRGAVPILWKLFCQIMNWHISSNVICDKLLNVLFLNLGAFGLIFYHILLHLDNPHSWELIFFQSKELNHTTMIILFNVNDDKHYLVPVKIFRVNNFSCVWNPLKFTLVAWVYVPKLRRKIMDHLVFFFIVRGIFADEEQDVGLDKSLENLLSRFMIELN